VGKKLSDFMTQSLKAYGQWRDNMTEKLFYNVYGQTWLQEMLGIKESDGSPRKHPGEDPDHAALVKRRIGELRNKMDKGGPREATIRSLLYVRTAENAGDERNLRCFAEFVRNMEGKQPFLNLKRRFAINT
jgi:hypothetical protein